MFYVMVNLHRISAVHVLNSIIARTHSSDMLVSSTENLLKKGIRCKNVGRVWISKIVLQKHCEHVSAFFVKWRTCSQMAGKLTEA